jgi:beta-lactamase class A
MRPLFLTPFSLVLLLFVAGVDTASAQTNAPGAAAIAHSDRLQELVDRTAQQTLKKFGAKKLERDQLAITLVDLSDPQKPAQAAFRGGEQIYPASVVKLFYLAAAHRWMEDGKLKDTEELRRALRDMIVESLNEATGLIVDSLTDTTSGPELPAAELEAWYQKRNAVNRYYSSLGYTNINVNRKPWCEGPYGREMQSVQLHKPNHRNWLTTDATARLLTEIVTGKAISAERCKQMMELLHRDPAPDAGNKNDQAHAFSALGLPSGAKLWSKAGWTSQSRHDAAYVELPTGQKFVLVTFTNDHAGERDILATVARAVVEGFSAAK